MNDIILNTVTFLTLLNPFALYIYLVPVQNHLSWRDFVVTVTKASLIAGAIYMLSAFFGQAFFEDILKINFEAFRIFGGIVLLLFSLSYIVQGRQSMITLKGDLDDLAGEIALPFMVGAGTISLSIIIGSRGSAMATFATISLVMLVNLAIVLLMATMKNNTKRVPIRKKFLYNTEILLRMNGFILGAIGIDMIARGIEKFF